MFGGDRHTNVTKRGNVKLVEPGDVWWNRAPGLTVGHGDIFHHSVDQFLFRQRNTPGARQWPSLEGKPQKASVLWEDGYKEIHTCELVLWFHGMNSIC